MGKQRFPIRDFLANLPLFGGLEAEAIARLAAGSSECDARRGTIVYHRGQPGGGMHFVVYGQVKLSLHIGDGDERVIGLVDPGSSFGEAPMFLGKPYLTTAEAIVDSKLLLVGKEALLAEVRRDPGFSHTVIANLSAKLYQQMQNLEICTLSSGVRRVIRYLLHYGPTDAVGAALHITLPTKKWIIASRLNLTHEHFSRILHALIRDDLIEVDGRQVRIPDPVRLRALVAD
jgi:CRP/FNR family transcriptional regulator, dissimilatory nitrate respiration regulator